MLLDREGRARLTDFGIAQPRDATSLTQTGLVLGTAPYLAPEVLEGGAPSERSDLYSLGVLLAGVSEARPAGPALRELIGSLRAPEPAARPASAAAALRELERSAIPSVGGVATPTTTVPSHRGPGIPGRGGAGRSPHRPLVLGALAVAALAVAAIALLTAGGEPETTRAPSAERGGREGPAERQESQGGARDRNASESRDREPDAGGEEDGRALNDRGFELINEGSPAEAILLLEQAVAALDGSGDIYYAYALYNLGLALRLAGRSEEAIPILEARLEIPNQTGAVSAELERAREDAGLADEDSGKGRGRGKGRGGDD